VRFSKAAVAVPNGYRCLISALSLINLLSPFMLKNQANNSQNTFRNFIAGSIIEDIIWGLKFSIVSGGHRVLLM